MNVCQITTWDILKYIFGMMDVRFLGSYLLLLDNSHLSIIYTPGIFDDDRYTF